MLSFKKIQIVINLFLCIERKPKARTTLKLTSSELASFVYRSVRVRTYLAI